MTAVVGILNTSAVAIAADSAVTVSGPSGQKVYNTGNKIFQLSKKHPVGIAIYGSGSLLITPWEVIIKSYRKKLGDKSFDTVIDYRNDFLAFLATNSYFTTGVGSAISIIGTVKNVLDDVVKSVNNKFANSIPNDSPSTLSFDEMEEARNVANQYINDVIDILDSAPDNEGNAGKSTESEILDEIDKQLSSVDPNTTLDTIIAANAITKSGLIDPDLIVALKRLIPTYYKKCHYVYSNYTGLIFVGYGDKEIYPQLHCIQIADVVGSLVRWNVQNNVAINEIRRSDIIPFAQTEVIYNVIEGISPKLETEVVNIMSNIFSQLITLVADTVRPGNATLANQLSSLDVDPLVKTFTDSLSAIKGKHFNTPTLDAVMLLSKEDLAEMAESLVYSTYLQKRMTLDAETVGKPVDVAVISKNDGFVWIKRKYYFEQSLNPHFLRNYFE